MIGRRLGARSPGGGGLVADGDDSALLDRALADPHAFEPLFTRYWDAVYRYCLYRLDHREDAEDTAIQVFTKAYASLNRFSARQGTFRSWLFTIAHNEVANRHRQRDRHPGGSLALADAMHDPSPLPEERALVSLGIAEARGFLGQLPERPRRVVELRLAGLTDLEIAAVLGITHAAVRQAQTRAVVHLRNAMGVDATGSTGREAAGV